MRTTDSSNSLYIRRIRRPGMDRRRKEGARLKLVEDRVTDAPRVPPQMGIPESQRFDAVRLQESLALGIVILPVRKTVLAAVQFDVQGGFLAKEIQIVITNGMLTAEFIAVEAAVTQPDPNKLLRPSFVLP